MAGALSRVFGASATITPASGPVAEVTAIFRENPREVVDDAGRVHVIDEPTLQVAKPVPAALVKGSTVAPSITPGRTFRVLGVYPDRSPAADAFVVCALEEVTS